MMRIIEEYRQSKTGDLDTCEDTYVVNEHFVAVIDGATNVSGQTYDGLTPGQIVSQTVRQTLQRLDAEAGIEKIVEEINRDLVQRYRDIGIYELVVEHPYYRPSASMVIYSRQKHTVWMIGDCQCMIDGKLYLHTKVIDDITANARALYLESELLKGKTIEDLLEHDTAWEAVIPFVQVQYYFQNQARDVPYAYEVINGLDMNFEMIETIQVPASARELVFASDGYPQLFPTLAQSERILEEILAEDPLCFRRYKCTKGLKKGNVSFDDRAYLKIQL